MKITCVWEHNGDDTLLYSNNVIGAFTRGANKEQALAKFAHEIKSYYAWSGDILEEDRNTFELEIVQEKKSDLHVSDADSDVLFDSEREVLSREEYETLKGLVLKSAKDFYNLYESIPDKDQSRLPTRTTFYGVVPRTAREMYVHTKNVNSYYWCEIGVKVDNEGSILECREKGFQILEQMPDFLENVVRVGSYDEYWSLRKVLRRFLWHDRIHAKGMFRMANQTFGTNVLPDIFHFNE
ncbi:flagellar M-ring protein FliF [Lachnospiraceae bacterium KM106-2]|nr:flagellar M-ring protein FliF [Lachnospiraceae bacterium KM106-2]